MPIHMIQLVRQGILLNILRIRLYSLSFLFEILGNVAFVTVTLLFWQAIYASFPSSIHWTKPQMYLFIGYVELFIALKNGIFPVTGKLWRFVFSGQIDTYFTRPVHPAILFIVNNFHLEYLAAPLPTIAFLFLKSSSAWTVAGLAGGILIVLAAVFITALLELTASGLAFWFGNISAIDEIVDSFLQMNKYPLTLLGYGWQAVFSIALPFMFNATVPSQLATGMHISWISIYGGIFTLVFWPVLVYSVWKGGRRRYEGYGG